MGKINFFWLLITGLFLTIFCVLPFSHSATPTLMDTPGCTSWQEDRSSSCVFAGEDGAPWYRECGEDSVVCRMPRYDHTPCDAKRICVDGDTDPNQLSSTCTSWSLVRGVTCANSTRKWERACQKAWIKTGACSNTYPSEDEQFMEGRFILRAKKW